eukprot:CAMPEP_0119315318 /NCGR_PEP_ID=MMETSP1333-20130426/35310_1 /TAXON_ID=418940 /ORGANISM="Scyphosphaera apsteinii, Strain RCC1455" /LENGTH=148 /DNA_ID=CAMNT_0007320635 /DNA_START=331 /DNA_END=772 /DNA_ORIENTATION=-
MQRDDKTASGTRDSIGKPDAGSIGAHPPHSPEKSLAIWLHAAASSKRPMAQKPFDTAAAGACFSSTGVKNSSIASGNITKRHGSMPRQIFKLCFQVVRVGSRCLPDVRQMESGTFALADMTIAIQVEGFALANPTVPIQVVCAILHAA